MSQRTSRRTRWWSRGREERPVHSGIRSVLYASFEALVPGTAPFTHVHGLAAAIDERPDERCTIISAPAAASTTAKLVGYLSLTLRIWRAAAQHDLVMLRYHPAQTPLQWLLLRRGHGPPVLVEVNGVANDAVEAYPQLRPLRGVIRGAMEWCCNRADLVIAVTDDLREELERASPQRRVAWAQNGTEVRRFQPIDPADRPADVLFVGALARWQGIGCLLEAVASAHWPPDTLLYVAGDGPLREQVEASTDERVRYLGQLSPDGLTSLYDECAISVSPKTALSQATSRGLSPLKVAEAHAAGCALIVSDIPGQADLVRRAHSGLVVLPDDPTALAIAVERLVTDDALRHQCMTAARAVAVTDLSWGRTWETISAALGLAGRSDR